MFLHVNQKHISSYTRSVAESLKGPKVSPTWQQVHKTLFPESKNIYDEYEPPKLLNVAKYDGAFASPDDLHWMFSTYGKAPQFVLEVGTFVGSSAIKIGKHLRGRNEDAMLLCVDPFTGSGEMWFSEDFRKKLAFRAGQPRIFEMWMNNILRHGLQKTVLPWRVTSLVAADFLHYLPWKVDFIFLDSAHSLGETFAEIAAFWGALDVGSYIFGDDYLYNSYPGVKHDVDLFCKMYEVTLLKSKSERIWGFQKK